MELKLFEYIQQYGELVLLIVPYGIETFADRKQRPQQNVLLIVPYGIETQINTGQRWHTELF